LKKTGENDSKTNKIEGNMGKGRGDRERRKDVKVLEFF
jgi:hypothetical protein